MNMSILIIIIIRIDNIIISVDKSQGYTDISVLISFGPWGCFQSTISDTNTASF